MRAYWILLGAACLVRAAFFAWFGAVGVLHWLPFLNGYKFVYLLPLPVCVLATPGIRALLVSVREREGQRVLVLHLAVLAGGAGQLLFPRVAEPHVVRVGVSAPRANDSRRGRPCG